MIDLTEPQIRALRLLVEHGEVYSAGVSRDHPLYVPERTVDALARKAEITMQRAHPHHEPVIHSPLFPHDMARAREVLAEVDDR